MQIFAKYFNLVSGGTSSSWVTITGEFVTNLYEKTFPHGDFCIDRADTDPLHLTAVMCDPCQEKACISRCCPHGHAKTYDYETDEFYCSPSSKDTSLADLLWSSDWTHQEDIQKNKDYVLLGSKKEGFSCPIKNGVKEAHLSDATLHGEIF